MAMTKCRECGNEISTTATSCPKCGAKITRTSLLTKLVLGFIVLIVVSGIWTSRETDRTKDEQANVENTRRATLSAEQRAAEDKQKADAKAAADKATAKSEAAFQKALLVARAVKHDAKDPSSVEFVEALVTDDGTVALKFRAKNSFGALVVNSAILTKDGKTAVGSEQKTTPLWNKYVANRDTQDVTRAIRGAIRLGVL